jgi:NADH dehydrogenase
VLIASYVDDEGRPVTAAQRIGYDTLVIAVGNQSNDFGTPGVAAHAMKLETADDARRFNRRLVNAAIRAHEQPGDPRSHRLRVAIIGAGATGVELSAELHRTTRELITYGLDRIDPEQDLELHLIEAAPARAPCPAGTFLQ